MTHSMHTNHSGRNATRSLAEIAAGAYYLNVYVLPLFPMSSAAQSQATAPSTIGVRSPDETFAALLGVVPFPDSCRETNTCHSDGYRLLRILGTNPAALNCNSTILAYTNRPVTPFADSNCSTENVGYICLAPNEMLQTATVSYSVFPSPALSGCGCAAQSPIGTASATEVGLGTHDLPNGSRFCSRHGVDTRSEWTRVYATITHPSLGDFIQIARECATGCATVALITAVATNVGAAAAIAVFKACFYQCLKIRVSEAIANGTNIDVGYNGESGDWSGH